MKTKLLALLVTLILFSPLKAQSSAGDAANMQALYLIDMPIAGVVDLGYVSLASDLMPNGLVLGRIDVGVFENLSFGISYGGGNIIGRGEIDWNKFPGVNIRYGLIQESLLMPAITVGFDSQGKGPYFDSQDRYEIKSPGFFAAASKNYEFLGYLSLHAAVNYSLEKDDGDNFANIMVGVEKTIGSAISVVADYNFGLNDNGTDRFGKGDGYLNVGVRWSVAPGFTLGLDLRDMLENKQWSPSSADRAVKLQYVQKIL